MILLVAFEEAWILGTEHILDPRNREHVKVFSNLIQNLAYRHVTFKQKLDSCEAQVFLQIPALAILYDLREIISRFAPSLNIEPLTSEVSKSGKFDLVERDVLDLG